MRKIEVLQIIAVLLLGTPFALSLVFVLEAGTMLSYIGLIVFGVCLWQMIPVISEWDKKDYINA